MNILLVNNIYPPTNTGSSFYTQALAKLLYKRGHEVTVLTTECSGKELLEIEDGIKVYRLQVVKLPKSKIWMNFPDFSFSLTPNNKGRIEKIIREEKISIIHQCNNIFDLVFFSSFFANKFNIPLFCSVQTQIQHTNTNINKALTYFDSKIVRRLFANYVDGYISSDGEVLRYIKERFDFRGEILSLPLIVPEKSLARAYISQKQDYSKTNYTIFSLGHISPLKDRIDLIKAVALVKREIPKIRLLVAGGIFVDGTKELISSLSLDENVSFTGRIPYDEVFNHVGDVDFNCMFLSKNLPYHRGIGIANYEMMAAGLPTVLDITNGFLGPDYDLRDGVHYLSAGDRSPEHLSRVFVSLLKDPAMREMIGKNGQKFIMEKLKWDDIIAKLEQLYQKQSSLKGAPSY